MPKVLFLEHFVLCHTPEGLDSLLPKSKTKTSWLSMPVKVLIHQRF